MVRWGGIFNSGLIVIFALSCIIIALIFKGFVALDDAPVMGWRLIV